LKKNDNFNCLSTVTSDKNSRKIERKDEILSKNNLQSKKDKKKQQEKYKKMVNDEKKIILT
jgi:hypothetical protein